MSVDETTAAAEGDFAELGPATLLAIRTAVAACDREIALLEEKLTFRRVRGAERSHIERELAEWRATRSEVLSTKHHPPVQPERTQHEVAGGEESPRR